MSKQRFFMQSMIMYYNGFGYQFDEESCNFYIAKCVDISTKDLEEIRHLSGASTLNVYDQLGRNFLEISYTDYDKIDTILTVLLRLGINFAVIWRSGSGI